MAKGGAASPQFSTLARRCQLSQGVAGLVIATGRQPQIPPAHGSELQAISASRSAVSEEEHLPLGGERAERRPGAPGQVRSGNPDVAFLVEHGVAIECLAARVRAHRLARLLEPNEIGNGEAVRIIKRPLGVGCRPAAAFLSVIARASRRHSAVLTSDAMRRPPIDGPHATLSTTSTASRPSPGSRTCTTFARPSSSESVTTSSMDSLKGFAQNLKPRLPPAGGPVGPESRPTTTAWPSLRSPRTISVDVPSVIPIVTATATGR
jgi:hypothetical protein